MKILLSGATGYIGKRLLHVLLEQGHDVICCVRDKDRFDTSAYPKEKVRVIEVNFLHSQTLDNIPDDIESAYYLIHSMSSEGGDFEELERQSAENFRDRIQQTGAKQVIYLSGIVNEDKLSKHLRSRKQVEEILRKGSFHLTTLRAGIIVGSGSASFEIIRDLVEKLPVMVAPRWLNTRSQPIAIRNVLQFLNGVLLLEDCYDKSYDIGGPEILTYREMLLKFARVRKLRRYIKTLPVMTPRLSSYWLYFVTSTSYKLAVHLVNSMKIEIICKPNKLTERLGIKLLSYEEAVQKAFDRIEQHEVISSWTDAQSSALLESGISKLISVPTYGCFTDERTRELRSEAASLQRIWNIGGDTGWYYANALWSLRGFVDKLLGGVGHNRGRTDSSRIKAGDALDFWRVLYANKEEKRLLLYAEMKLPGEAWLEFSLDEGILKQTATFRPLGLWGRIYWYMVLPFHGIVFKGLLKKLAA